jgi:hypothetical protein
MGGFEEATLALAGLTVHAVAGGGSVIALELLGEPDLTAISEEARHIVASWTATEHRLLEWVR